MYSLVTVGILDVDLIQPGHSSVGRREGGKDGQIDIFPFTSFKGWSAEGNGSPLQYSGLGNPTDSGTWRATVHGVASVRHDLATKPPPNHYTT